MHLTFEQQCNASHITQWPGWPGNILTLAPTYARAVLHGALHHAPRGRSLRHADLAHPVGLDPAANGAGAGWTMARFIL